MNSEIEQVGACAAAGVWLSLARGVARWVPSFLPKKTTRLWGVLACAGLLSGCGDGCGVPGTAFYNCFYYYTDDMSKVRVNLVGADKKPIGFSFSIERGYIVAALPYEAKKAPRLPEQIEVSDVSLIVAMPYGLPLQIARRKAGSFYPDYSYVEINGVGAPWRRNSDKMFTPQYDMFCRDAELENGAAARYLGEQDGYKMYAACQPSVAPPGFHIPPGAYAGPPNAPRKINCMSSRGTPKMRCPYGMWVADLVRLSISVPDYRSNGGIIASDDYARKVLAILCPKIGCDDRYVADFMRGGRH